MNKTKQIKTKRIDHRKKKLLNIWRDLVRSISRLLWPEVCPFCGKINTSGPCARCIFALRQLQVVEPRCFCCGKPVDSMEKRLCYDCEKNKHYFEQGISLWIHREPVKYSIYQFKYHNLREAADYYSSAIYYRYKDVLTYWNLDLIIPVPLHGKRRRSRGYNQACLVAEQLGRLFHIPVDKESVRRVNETSPQKKLDHTERKRNLQQAFAISDRFHPVPCVLIVDDIYTTGNTIDSVAKLLKSKGVQKVYFVTISIGAGD